MYVKTTKNTFKETFLNLVACIFVAIRKAFQAHFILKLFICRSKHYKHLNALLLNKSKRNNDSFKGSVYRCCKKLSGSRNGRPEQETYEDNFWPLNEILFMVDVILSLSQCNCQYSSNSGLLFHNSFHNL